MNSPKRIIERVPASISDTDLTSKNDLSVSTAVSNEQDEQFETLRDATIMMVDDEPITTEVVRMFLEEAGYKYFITTSDSSKAFELFKDEGPDVVLLDLMMPGVNGFDILAQIRADKELRHIPVIVLTSSTDAETKLSALNLGANDFLSKPVDPSELALRLRNTLAAKVYQDRLAFFDALTDLPNRRTFLNHLDWALRRTKSKNVSGAILKIDLDRFKEINDTLGPSIGDLILKEIAQRLKECLRFSDTIGRLGQDFTRTSLCRVGGNEFTVLLPGIDNVESAAQIAKRIIRVIEPPCHPAQHELFITASIGISVFPDDGDTMDPLLKNADVAISHAKQHGGNIFQFYSKEINAESEKRLKFAHQLRGAIERNELVLYYQPKIDNKRGEIIGAEALMRWQHPEIGIVSPVNFIPIAEEIGLISAFDEWALLTACLQIKTWRDAGLKPINISANITSHSFRQGTAVKSVERSLIRTGLDPKYIKLELTEGLIMDNSTENIETLHRLKEIGIKLSIDDFGTGYSSLSYLSKFPLDELKIDRSFIMDLPGNSNNVAIVKAIIAMAHGLSLSVVAEGVETQQQLDFLSSLQCDEFQGYFFSKPIPAEEFSALLAKQ